MSISRCTATTRRCATSSTRFTRTDPLAARRSSLAATSAGQAHSIHIAPTTLPRMIELLSLWTRSPWARLGLALAAGLIISLLVRAAAYVALGRLAKRQPVLSDILRRASAPMEWLLPLLVATVALRTWPASSAALFALLQKQIGRAPV